MILDKAAPAANELEDVDKDVEDVDEDLDEDLDEDVDERLPVVARLIVEVRSDGRRTIARGLVEDLESGRRTAVMATGESQMALLGSLMRTATGFAALARRAVRALNARRGS